MAGRQAERGRGLPARGLAAAAALASSLWRAADAARLQEVRPGVVWSRGGGTDGTAVSEADDDSVAFPLRHMSAALPPELVATVLDAVPFRWQVASWSGRSVGNVSSLAGDDAVTLHGARGPRAKLQEHGDGVDGACFFPHGRWMLTWVEVDGEATIWDVASGRALRTFPGTGSISSAAVFPEGDRIVVCGHHGACTVWHSASGEKLARFRKLPSPAGERLAVNVIVFPFGDKLVLSGLSFDERFDFGPLVWDVAADRVVCEANRSSHRMGFGVVFPDASRMAGGNMFEDTVTVWSAESCGALHELRHPQNVWDVAVLEGGAALATLWNFQRATIWDMATGKPRRELVTPAREGDQLALAKLVAVPQSAGLVTVTGEYATVWDTETGEAVRHLHERGIDDIVVAPGGDTIVACTVLGQVVAWDVLSGRRLYAFTDERQRESGVYGCGVAVGIGNALDPNGFGRGLSWRDLPEALTSAAAVARRSPGEPHAIGVV